MIGWCLIGEHPFAVRIPAFTMQSTLLSRVIHAVLFLILILNVRGQAQLYAPNSGAVGPSTTANVGIGTNAPGVALDVNGPVRSFAGSIDVRLQAGAAGAAGIGSFSNDPVLFFSAGAERMRLTTTGRLGIGTQSPAAMLHTHGPSDGMNFFFTTAGATASWNGGAYSDNSFRINQAGVASRLVIDSMGNVGVGTANPQAKLTVCGAYSTFVEAGGANAITCYPGNGGYNQLYSDYWSGTSALPLALGAYPSTRALVLLGNGNVGVGTTSPTQKLSVNGTVRAKEVIVDTGWPDFVFDEDYKLKTLSETEAFVRTEKHLPGIPSATDVAENGISVGEMQAKLLAKIEELTLHQIEQEKEIARLKARLVAVEAR